MHRFLASFAGLALGLASLTARAETAQPDFVSDPRGDLFPGAGRPTFAAGTGLPFFGIAELGIGVTKDVAVGVVGGVTPSVVTAGLRPRFRIETSRRTALVFVSPVLYYPKASAPGPGNVGTSSWVLAKPELFFDAAVGERLHLAGGMGIVAAASLEALDQLARGEEFAMPPYGATNEQRRGFAGGLWNTLSARGSYALAEDTRLFAEASAIMKGVLPADGVGGPPVVVTLGAQHGF